MRKYYVKIGIEHFAYGLIIPISIIWKLNNGLSLFEAAVTEAVILIITALLSVPTGVFADKNGNKKSMIIGGLLQTAALALLAVGGSFTVFLISAVLSGAGWAFLAGADEAYLHDDYLEDSGLYQKVFANSTIADEVSTLTGMMLGSLILYVQSNMRPVFLVATAFSFMSVLYLLVFLPDNRAGKKKANVLVAEAIHSKNVKTEVKRLSLVFLAFAVMFESGRVLWQPQLAHIGVDIAKFGLLFAIFQIASIAGSYLARHSKAFSTKKLAVLFAVMITSLLVFGSESIYVSIAALTIFLLGENYFRVYMSSTLNRLIKSNRATLLSIASMTRGATSGGLVLIIGLAGNHVILLGLFMLAAIKVPAAFYIITHRELRGPS